MAKNKTQTEATDPTTQATNAAIQQQATTNPTSTNVKMVKLIAPLTNAAGETVKNAGDLMARKDFIRHRWSENRVDRGQITKDLTAMNTTENGGDGKKIPYQVVFAVLKKGAEQYGGPVKAEGTQTAQTGETAAAA